MKLFHKLRKTLKLIMHMLFSQILILYEQVAFNLFLTLIINFPKGPITPMYIFI